MPFSRCEQCGEVFHVDVDRVDDWAAVEKDDEGFGKGVCDKCGRAKERPKEKNQELSSATD